MKELDRRAFLKMSLILAGTFALPGCVRRPQITEPKPTIDGQLDKIKPTATVNNSIKVEPTATIYNPMEFFFNDTFNNAMFLDKWRVYRGNPKVRGGFLMLSETDIQSKDMFNSGILQGVISSHNWKPQDQFTDSSFGFETWAGKDDRCHSGVLFKANGHLAVLRSQPYVDDKCMGDPEHQVYPPIPNWDAIRAKYVVSFKLNWNADEIILQVNGNGLTEQVSYSGPAIPKGPLNLRFYTQIGELYEAHNIALSDAPHAIYQPKTQK